MLFIQVPRGAPSGLTSLMRVICSVHLIPLRLVVTNLCTADPQGFWSFPPGSRDYVKGSAKVHSFTASLAPPVGTSFLLVQLLRWLNVTSFKKLKDFIIFLYQYAISHFPVNGALSVNSIICRFAKFLKLILGLFIRKVWELLPYTVCPTRYRTRHFFNNSNTNEDIATKFEQEYVRCSGVPRGGVWGVQTPPPEILKISVESSIA